MLTKKEGNVERWQNSEVEEKNSEEDDSYVGEVQGDTSKANEALWKTGAACA